MSSYFGNNTGFAGGKPYLSPLQQVAAIQATRKRNYRKPPKAQNTEGFIGGLVPDIVEKAIGQIASSLVNTPAGLYGIGKAITQDQYDLIRHLDVTPERSLGIYEGIGRSIYEDLRHPGENPGYALMDAFSIASLGLGSVSRLGAVSRGISEAGGGGAATRLLAKGARLPPSMTDASLGIMAPDALGAFRDLKASAADSFKAKIEQRRLRLTNQAKAAEADRKFVDQTPQTGPQAAMLSARTRVNPATGRAVFGDQFEELQLPNFGQLNPRRQTPLGRPEGMAPVGLASETQPLFPRPRTATLEQGVVPAASGAGAGQMSLFPEPVPQGIHADRIHPLTGQGVQNQQARLDAQRALQEWRARMASSPMLEREAGLGTAAEPFVAGPGGIEPPAMRTVLGQEAAPINPAGFTPVTRVPGEGLPIEGPRPLNEPRRPAPAIAEPATAAAPTEASKRAPLQAPDVSPGEIQFQLDEHGVVHAHWDGNPTGFTAHRIHKKSATVDATWAVLDGDKPVFKVRQSELKRQLANAAAEKLNPGVLDRLEAEGHDIRPPADHVQVINEPPAPAQEIQGGGEGAAKPKMTIEDAPDDYALRKTMSDEQIAATDSLPAIYKHVYTAQDGTIALRNSDDLTDFKVYGPDGKELKGAAWAEHKRAAYASIKKPASDRVAADAAAGKKVSAKDVEVLDADIPPELAKVGLTFRQQGLNARALGVNPKMVEQTFNVSKEQAAEISKRIFPGVRNVYKDAQTNNWKTPRIRKELRKVLHDELGKELGDKAFGMVMSVKGGVDLGPRQIGKIVMQGLTGPRERIRIPISTRALKETTHQIGGLPKGLSKEAIPEIKTTDLQPLSAEILASNNPLVRMATRLSYGLLQLWDNPYAKGGAGNLANRTLKRKIAFENREVGRIVQAAELAGLTPKMEAEAKRLEQKGPRTIKGSLGQAIDTSNQLAQIGILFLKPAYISANLIGQVLLTLNDHSWNPINVAKSAHMQREMFGGGELSKGNKLSPKAQARSRLIKKLMGEGFVTSVKTGSGLSRSVETAHAGFSKFYSSILDTPFRDNAFLNEARRQGFTDGHEVAKLLDEAIAGGPKSAAYKQMTDIGRRANRNLIDYGRLTGTEKAFVRRVIFFYPWMKGATIYGARFAAEHPLSFAVQEQAGKLAAERNAQELGQVPSYLEGTFKIGDRTIPGLGKLPTIMNPQSISILGTPAEAFDVARGLLSGSPRQSDTLGEMVTPAVNSAFAAIFNINPFTGHKLGPGEGGLQAAWDTAIATPAPLRLLDQIHQAGKMAKGELDPASKLFPMSSDEAVGRFLGPGFGAAVGHPFADYTLNTREARSRATAEQRSLQSKVESKKALWKDYTQATQLEAARVGVNLGPDFKKAMAVKAEREANIAAAQQAKGSKLDKFDRLQADLSLLVRMKKISNKQARQYAETFAQAGEGDIDSFRRDIGEQYFGQAVLSGYKSYLSDLGAKVPYR